MQQKPTHNQPEYTVSELSARLKRTVEDAYGFVRVRGEISGLKRAASGHIYFSLKDENAVLNGICWRGVAEKLPFKPQDGLEVICVGKISTYPGRSNYQMIADWMEPAGAGALMALLEERKKKLAAEGLFDPSRKRPLPYLPRLIGVVTSPTGAVIRDILHRLEDRFPRPVLLWPVLVQGEGAAEQVAAAITGFNLLTGPQRPDVLILARGGGSIEDLWAFNEEIVVRAVAASDIPTISAVGHETDTTLADFASDRRAPTPTAAAEMAVPVRAELFAALRERQAWLTRAMARMLEQRFQLLQGLKRGLISPKQKLEGMTQRLDDVAERLHRAVTAKLERKMRDLQFLRTRLQPTLLQQRLLRAQDRLEGAVRLLGSLHYKNVLARGFALVRSSTDNSLITGVEQALFNQKVVLEFHDGNAPATVGSSSATPRKPSIPAKSSALPGQTDLFTDVDN